MGQRTEQRVAVAFRVIVRGLDSHGHPFEKTVETHDISCSGACLYGLNNIVSVGSRIEIQYKEQMAWYRVQWVDSGPAGSGRTGVRCLEPGNYVWGVPPKEWAADTYDPAHPTLVIPEPVEVAVVAPKQATWYGADRRQFPRRSCRIEAQVSTDNGAVQLPGTVTDISLGGCYVEMLAPLPIDTAVEIMLRPEGAALEMSGNVRSSQTGLGMGIAFTGMRPADFEKLQKLAPVPTRRGAVPQIVDPTADNQRPATLTANTRPAPAPMRSSAPRNAAVRDVPATPEAFQAIVRLLFHKGLITQEELMEELEKLKPTRV
ncbi:MAG TPA: PilZ domain-containing protein [Candidatus Acidoferrales bacterium]|nr:PilZ domain-containing protein [Candidatus Acidoferrales bacterium]